MSSNQWSLDKLLKIAKDKEAAAKAVESPSQTLKIAAVPPPTLLTESANIPEANPVEVTSPSPSSSEQIYSSPFITDATVIDENSSSVESTSLTDSVLHFWEALGEWKRGHLSLPNQIVLVLYMHLDPAEQAIYTQLFAMSWGYGKPDCFCNLATLAARSGMGTTAAGQAVKRLVSKGLIEKSSVQLGKGNNQGITYRLPLPDRLTDSVRLTRSGRLTDSTDKKDLDQKQIKKGVAVGDCPDCNGTFWIYPDGPDGGVKKCSHPKLKRTGR